MITQEVNIDNYKILRCDRNRHEGGVACYITNNLSYNMRNDLSYNILSVFPCKIENIFFEILLPNSKPMIVGTIYRPSTQNNFLELMNSNMKKINSVDDEIYILGNFSINFFLNDFHILEKKNILNSKSIPSYVKSYHEFCAFFWIKAINRSPNKDDN